MSGQPARAGGRDPGAVLAAIWARHRDDALRRVAALEDAVVALLENRLSEGTRRDAERDAHRLAGSTGTFGFPQASESARQLERILAGTEPILPAGMLLAADEVVALRTALNTGPAPAPVVARGPAPVTPIHSAPAPALALPPGDMLSGRREVARGYSRGFPGTAALPQELPDAAEGLPAGTPTAGATVLLVVSPDVLPAAGAVLVSAGLRVAGLEDPERLWTALEEEQPDLLILDLDMPQVGAGRLCREIRSDARWAGLPILFFTEHSDPVTIGAIFAAGADDFVARPFSGPELLARVQARIERTRLLQALVETDPLTGLASRRRAEPGLQLLLGLAKRHSQPFSIARLDLDGFEDVNGQHGRDSGDTVLRHVESVLRRSFRCEDVVARWGSHEFLLGIHGLARDEGERMIASLLEALNGERFATPAGAPLAVRFNAGIATYPGDATTVAGLYEAAGRAFCSPKRTDGRELPAAAPPAAGPNVDVVVVEDDEALAELLEHALTTRGYRFHHLADGQSAVDQLAGSAPALRPRVLLLDLDLPVLNGFGVLRQMAAAGTLAGTRVIMLTARSGEREVVEALKLGAFDHVAKPFSVPVLMQRIHRALGT